MFSTLLASLAFTAAEPAGLQNTSSIPEVAIGSKRLDTLVTAVKAAGLRMLWQVMVRLLSLHQPMPPLPAWVKKPCNLCFNPRPSLC